ncbi:unnamed protein product [Closterium sp. NIES-53]
MRPSSSLSDRPRRISRMSDRDGRSKSGESEPAGGGGVPHSRSMSSDENARRRTTAALGLRTVISTHKTAKALYDAVVARYFSPITAALGCLIVPYLFPKLSAFATIEDLVSHLRTSDAPYRAALPAKFLDRKPPPLYITLYFIVTRLPDSLRAVRDHFLALDPTDLTVDLLEQHLLAAETRAVAVGAARGTPRTPFFEGTSGLLLLVGSAAAAGARVVGVEEVAAGVVVGAAVEVVEVVEVVAAVGVVAGVGALVAAVVAAVGVAVVAAGGVVAVEVELFRGEVLAVASGSSSSVRVRPLHPSSFTCGKPHTQHRCFSRLDIAWRAKFGDEAERPRWAELLRSGVAIFDLDYDAILAAMYALSVSAEGDCYLCVPPDPGIEAAALGASESALPGTAPAEALHTFTLDSVLSGSLSGLHLPSFFTNLVSTSALQDAMVTTTTPGGQRVSICTCTRTGCHLATFTRRPESSLYTLATEPLQVSASPPALACPALPSLTRGAASRRSSLLLVSPDDCSPADSPHGRNNGIAECCIGLVMEVARTSMIHAAAPHFLWPFAVRYAAHQLNLWPRVSLRETSPTLRLTGKVGDASVFRVRGSRALVYDTSADKLSSRAIPSVFLGFPPDAPGWQFYHPTSRRVLPSQDVMFDESIPFYRLFPYRSSLLPPLSLFLVPGPPPVDPLPPQGPAPSGVSQVDPLSGTVPVEVTVDSGAARGAASVGAASGGAEPAGADPGGAEPAGADPGGAESEGAGFKGAEPGGAEPGSTKPAGAERGVSEFEGAEPGGAEPKHAEPGGAKLGGAKPECVEPGGAEPERTGPGGTLSTGGLPGALLRREPLSPPQLREWFAPCTCLWNGTAGAGGSAAGGTRAARAGGAVGVGARGTGAGAAGGTGAASPGGARTVGTGAFGAGGAVGVGAGGTGAGGAGGARASGNAGVGAGDLGAGDTGAGGAGPGGAGAVGAGSRDTRRPRPYFVPLLQQVLGLLSSTGLIRTLVCPPPDQPQPPLQPASPLPAPSPYTKQTRCLKERRKPLSHPASPVRAVCTGRHVPRQRPPPFPDTHHMAICPSSVPQRVPLLSPPASSLSDGLDPESNLVRAASPTVTRLLATNVTDPLFESVAASALVAELVDFAAACRLDYAASLVAESDSVRPPSVRGECALGMDVLEDRQEDFECFAAAVPHLVSMLIAPEGDLDAPDIPTPRSYAEAIIGPYSSQLQTAMDVEMASWRSTGTYVDAVPPLGENIVDGMWIFRVKWPLGSPPAFKARYVARGFSQRQGVDFFQTFSPTPKMTTLRGSLHEEIWLRNPPGFTGSFPHGTQWSLRRPVYGLRQVPREWHDTMRTTLAALGFAPSTADPSLFLRTDTSLPPFYVILYVLQCFGFWYSSPQSTPLPTGQSLSDPPSNESVEPSGPYPELVGCLMYLMTYTRPDLAYPLSILAHYVAPRRHQPEHSEAAKRVLRYLCSMSGMGLVLGGRGLVVLTGDADASWVDDFATQRSSQGYTFSLGSGSVSWRSTRSSYVLSFSCEAEIYAGAMAAQELRWLTYLLTDLGERLYSSAVLYVDNKAMIALCQEHRLEHRMKHIALHYFLARDLQQHGQLRLTFVATRANTADIFTKALQSGDHQRFCTVLGLVPTLPHLLTA